MADSKSILKQYWGYDTFRRPQEEIIDSVLQHKDTIALLPTGGGKSICFQIPALLLQGKTIVVSPLIALMQDQVDNLFKRGILAKSLNANLKFREIDAILDNFVYGDLKLLYISPERIDSELFKTRIAKAKVSLIAVDESHCISQWGYDFRPSYFNIPKLRDIHPDATMIALTATATVKVLEDISEKLHLRKPVIFKKSFVRDNLGLTVIYGDNKRYELLQLLSNVKGSSIVYVRNRRETLEISSWLTQHCMPCVAYHGGMDKNVREQNQDSWMRNGVKIIVCTNAFGMGIDKPDVRMVVHLDVAPSLEEYFQEVGRAGRDGKRAHAVALIDDADIESAQRNLIEQYPSIEFITQIYDRLCRYLGVALGSGYLETYDFELQSFADHINGSARRIFHVINILEKEGWLTTSEAYKEPTRLMITANTEDLEYLNRNPSVKSKIFVHLLRKYEGLFMDYVKIDDSRIATDLGLDESKLSRYLYQLQSEGYISYIPRNAKPQITMMRERPKEEYFSIDKQAYNLRKKMAEDRLKAIIKYFKNDKQCRQKMIISYFGEKIEDCGMCDICLGSQLTIVQKDDIIKVMEHLKTTLLRNSINIKSYIGLYPYFYRKRVAKILQKLESERWLKVDELGTLSLAGL